MQQLFDLAPIALMATGALFIGWVAIRFVRWYEVRTKSELESAFHGLQVSSFSSPGSVRVEFYTFHGLLVAVTQTKWEYYATPEVAMIVLRRLHAFNARWGFLCPGAVFVPFLSQWNYWMQKRSIMRQSQHLSYSDTPSKISSGTAN